MARLPDFNPQDAAFLADPHGIFREMRRLEPVHWSSPLQSWILTRHADALAVLLDSETFAIGSAHAGGAVGRDIQRSSAGAPLPPTAMLTELDGPAHAKLRQHLASAFTPRALQPVRPSVRATAAGMLERSAGEPFEFVEGLAMPLPIFAAFALLGIHPEDQEPVYARASILMRAMQYADPRMREQIARAHGAG